MNRLVNLIGLDRIVRFIDFTENFDPTPRFLVKYWVFLVGYTAVWTVISRALF